MCSKETSRFNRFTCTKQRRNRWKCERIYLDLLFCYSALQSKMSCYLVKITGSICAVAAKVNGKSGVNVKWRMIYLCQYMTYSCDYSVQKYIYNSNSHVQQYVIIYQSHDAFSNIHRADAIRKRCDPSTFCECKKMVIPTGPRDNRLNGVHEYLPISIWIVLIRFLIAHPKWERKNPSESDVIREIW